ncbi:hypothetical protein V6Z11_A13G093400 [Gossypium hirsutum]
MIYIICDTTKNPKYITELKPLPWQRSSCFQLRIHKSRHFLPPWPEQNEIDPRYGVEKRLAPSGPNSLHN